MLFLVELDDVVVVPIPFEGLIGGELALKVGGVLPNHSYKFIVRYSIKGRQGSEEWL